MCPRGGYGQGVPPVVKTEFIIEASVFDNFEQSVKANLKSYLAWRMAHFCKANFGFLRWDPVSDQTTLSETDTKLSLKLTAQEREFGFVVSLEYAAEICGQKYPLSELQSILLYQVWDDQPTHDHARLQRDIEQKITENFGSDVFRKKLHKEFLKYIPLTEKIQVDGEDHRLIIPIKWHALNADLRSVMLVEFKATSHGEPKPGNMLLRPEGRNFKDKWQNLMHCTVCSVRMFSYPPIDVKAWDDAIPGILKSDRIESLKVFMNIYEKNLNPGTIGTTILDP